METQVSTLILLNKPEGITSAKAVERVKHVLQAKKAGHAGTLDPLATGLLIIGINEGTKALTRYLKLPKTYEAEILIGESTTTGDREGEVAEKKVVKDLPKDATKKALESMVGFLNLPVSAYSAIKQKGVPLYKRVRRGEQVELPIRKMEVRSVECGAISSYSRDTYLVKATFDVGSGTYIRSLAEELGKRLGYPAHLHALHRTRIGGFDIKDAEELSAFEK